MPLKIISLLLMSSVKLAKSKVLNSKSLIGLRSIAKLHIRALAHKKWRLVTSKCLVAAGIFVLLTHPSVFYRSLSFKFSFTTSVLFSLSALINLPINSINFSGSMLIWPRGIFNLPKPIDKDN